MLTIGIAVKGDLFITRPAGERLRCWLQTVLSRSDEDVILLDFRGVKAFDHSAADEAFAKLLIGVRAGLTARRCVVFFNPTEAQAEHLGWILERRNLLGVVRDRNETRLIGKVPSGVAAVFDYSLTGGDMGAADLASVMRISTNEAGRRLRKLWAAGVLTRLEVSDKPGGPAHKYRLRCDLRSPSAR